MGRDATNANKQSITAYLNEKDFKLINELKEKGVEEQRFGFSNYGDVVSYLLKFHQENYGMEEEEQPVKSIK